MRTRCKWMAAVAGMVLGGALWAGGMQMVLTSTEPGEGLTLVKFYNCGKATAIPMTAELYGADGTVRALQVAPSKQPPHLWVKGEVPREGKWVLVVTARQFGTRFSVVAPVVNGAIVRDKARDIREAEPKPEAQRLLAGL